MFIAVLIKLINIGLTFSICAANNTDETDRLSPLEKPFGKYRQISTAKRDKKVGDRSTNTEISY